MSDKQNQTPQPSQTNTTQQAPKPARTYMVDMRADQYGDRYPVTLGSGGRDKNGYGAKVKMDAYTVSGWLNVMNKKELGQARQDYREKHEARHSNHGQNNHER